MDQAILNLFKGIGQKRSEHILKKDDRVKRRVNALVKLINKFYVK